LLVDYIIHGDLAQLVEEQMRNKLKNIADGDGAYEGIV